ncbi:MAG: hypothetical protein CENE_02128 [Candidatus Celerinatantimonas neptuna]|nr:MAG: hypothetical protein CENE_02128 [Candidatus Celerinatantimonas neptuna]
MEKTLKPIHYLALSILLIVLTSKAMASDISDTKLKKDGYAGEAEAGINITSGNTNSSIGHGHLVVDFLYGHWRHNTDFETNYTKDSGVVSAERYYASYKANREWSKTFYTYGLITYENDRFNGFDHTVTTSLGYGHQLYHSDNMKLIMEIGPGWRHNETSSNSNEGIFRLAFNYQWEISKSATFHQKLTNEAGSNNTLTRTVSSISSTIWGPLALKASVTVTHQTHPIDDDEQPKHLDTLTALTLLYSF